MHTRPHTEPRYRCAPGVTVRLVQQVVRQSQALQQRLMQDEEDFDQLVHSLPAGFRDRVLSSCVAPSAPVPETTVQGDSSTVDNTSRVRDEDIFDAAATFRRKLGRPLGGVVSSGVVPPAPGTAPRSPVGSYSVNVNGRRVVAPSSTLRDLSTATAAATRARGRDRSRSSGRGGSTSPRSAASGVSRSSSRVGTGVPVPSPMPLLHESSFVQFVARQQAARKRREVRTPGCVPAALVIVSSRGLRGLRVGAGEGQAALGDWCQLAAGSNRA